MAMRFAGAGLKNRHLQKTSRAVGTLVGCVNGYDRGCDYDGNGVPDEFAGSGADRRAAEVENVAVPAVNVAAKGASSLERVATAPPSSKNRAAPVRT